ncbi:unnamed protein product [Dibothriocephalus latus]|uniref:Uncharacterized protein n=1 Tax=Dibothriocephalus latus TaxID=60516 RepID=A0A3P7N9V5_DIBLA|nr:unnamed protein product [Dibothriocephalus latus]
MRPDTSLLIEKFADKVAKTEISAKIVDSPLRVETREDTWTMAAKFDRTDRFGCGSNDVPKFDSIGKHGDAIVEIRVKDGTLGNSNLALPLVTNMDGLRAAN